MLYIKPTNEVLVSIDTYEDLFKLLYVPDITPEVFKARADDFRVRLMKMFPDKTLPEIMTLIDTYNEIKSRMEELYSHTHHNNYLTVLDFELRKNLTN